MRNENKVFNLQEDMEYKPVCEDSKVRVYLSLVRSEEERKLRAREVRRRNHKRRFIRQMIAVGVEAAKIVLAVVIALVLYHFLSAFMFAQRGYTAVGGELFFSAIVAAVIWRVLDRILGGVWYEK